MNTRQYGNYLMAAVGVLITGLLLTGCGIFRKAGGPPQRPAPEVAVVTVQPERIEITAELAGRVSAFLVAEVRPQVSGIIQKRLFEEGGDVKAGNLLYQIDPAFYEAAYASAKASLARTEANLPPARLKAERYKELVDIKAISQQNYDDAVAALKQAEADVGIARAAMETARINLAYTGITAPISGRIGKSSVTIGALATAHQAVPFTTIQQLDPVYVDAPQSSANLLRLKRNMASGSLTRDGEDQARVRLLLEDDTPYPLEGTLKFSDVTVDPSTSSFIFRTIFPNPDHTLLPGMYVRAVIEEGVNEQALLIPQQGISRDPKGNALAMLVDASDKAEQRAVKIDRAIGNKWLVTEGLKPGDRVIIEGVQKVKPGASVKVVPFDAGRKDSPGAGQKTPLAAEAK
ncbi:MAG: efflux RND transporter periplasmic adaptor subunit [Kiritimatiellaeota bacterium]|nr:efflux RND transporter periplasmic adaptor subunit [Kiritimatiellota bacterium]